MSNENGNPNAAQPQGITIPDSVVQYVGRLALENELLRQQINALQTALAQQAIPAKAE